MKKLLFSLICLLVAFGSFAGDKAPARQYYQLKIYHLKSAAQEQRVASFLRDAYVPALHRAGIKQVGVFKPVQQDTADLRVYVLLPFRTLEQFGKLEKQLEADKAFQQSGADYIDALHNNVPFARLESIMLQAFEGMPELAVPQLTSPKSERVYELRSYEGPTEKYFRNKVQMFNKGDEIGIFKKLGFNAVFYGEVIAGSHMPNLMYMTSFNNNTEREAHWKAFGADPDWKKLSGIESYKNNVSHIDKFLLRPEAYSDL
ncbi:NIPSNAP family protein [Chitinophaga horti]|uniref:NIPSNAP family protein n=1 Tax=Chitinophaga horti TaxID=2920382 RepID=A0ABY6J1V0_9BACT|nr:NIPSNAP family protein [Chitinophaga horti]UYQ93635.1 NIPSNAP family protein [Chitinophaga horti]